jgi:lipopolysaccharide heptosyltransferase II
MKLSATVVTFNESRNIARCLKSLSFCDEIIIADSHSTDETVALAKKYTKKIFPVEFSGFSDIKNSAIKKASSEWILSIDADEEISPELKNAILRAVSSKEGFDGYFIKRNDFFLGRMIEHCGWDRDYQLRLFKKNKGVFDGRKVHESVKLSGPSGTIEEPILHYSYPDSRTYFAKMNRYTTMQALEKQRLFPVINMFFTPFFKFFKMYFFKLGFLDGRQGFILSVYSGFSEFVKFAKMVFLKREGTSGSKLLLRAPNWIGDSVMMTAYLKELGRVYRDIYVACPAGGVGEILANNPHIRGIIEYDRRSLSSTLSAADRIRKEKITTGVSLSPSLSSYLLMFLAGVKIRAGYSSDLGRIFLNRVYDRDKSHRREHVMREYRQLFYLLDNSFDFSRARQEIFTGAGGAAVLKKYQIKGGSKRVLLAPFAKFGPSKMWPVENYIELIKMIMKKYKKAAIYVTGTKDDMDFDLGSEITSNRNFVEMRGAPLKDTAVIAADFDLFIGNDSGIMHMADAFGVNMAVIFGSTSPDWGGPVNSKAEVFYSGLDCQPCFEKECRFGHYNCLKNIKPADVFKKIKL